MKKEDDCNQDNEFSHEQKAACGLLKKAQSILNSDSGSFAEENMAEGESSRNEQKAIVLKNGIFTIAENLETSAVKQDSFLKELVDSVLFR